MNEELTRKDLPGKGSSTADVQDPGHGYLTVNKSRQGYWMKFPAGLLRLPFTPHKADCSGKRCPEATTTTTTTTTEKGANLKVSCCLVGSRQASSRTGETRSNGPDSYRHPITIARDPHTIRVVGHNLYAARYVPSASVKLDFGVAIVRSIGAPFFQSPRASRRGNRKGPRTEEKGTIITISCARYSMEMWSPLEFVFVLSWLAVTVAIGSIAPRDGGFQDVAGSLSIPLWFAILLKCTSIDRMPTVACGIDT
uniref:Uncharacterized protein n=1 Tax=Anopheles farauti TaxID=69004 RepID=A0A182Q4K5_9DIPT